MTDQEPLTRRISVVSRRVEKIAWEVDAADPEDAEQRYLMDGDEVGSSTESHEVIELDGRAQAPTPYDVSARVSMGDHDQPQAQVTVGPAEFTLHSSTAYSNTVNVETDGDFTGEARLRLHVNDCIVYDSTLPLLNHFQANEIEALLRTCAELYANSDTDGAFLSKRRLELAERVMRAWTAINGDPDEEGEEDR